MATVRRHTPITFETTLKDDARGLHEDWSGLASAAERRKIQNRINARSYRKRKAQLKATRLLLSNACADAESAERPDTDGLTVSQAVALEPTIHPAGGCSPLDEDPAESSENVLTHGGEDGTRALTAQSEGSVSTLAYRQSPSTDLLLNLVYYNIYRAVIANTSLLGLTTDEVCNDEMLSPFCDGANFGDHLPLALRPTLLQITTPHHPMFDVFPCPNLRDQMISNTPLYEDEDLCVDILGASCENAASSVCGMIVWGAPWDVASWEMTEDFYRKWFFLVHNSLELIASSNRWRATRGEPALKIQELQDLE